MTGLPDPLCMTPDELAGWHAANDLLSARQPSRDPCSDCLVAFARDMMAEGRCNGIPGLGRKPRAEPPHPAWRERNRLDYFARRLGDMGLPREHARVVA
jgi:hypothetical protein